MGGVMEQNFWLSRIGPGWHPLVQPLIDLCIQNGVPIIQVKEKFGGLRFYVGAASEEVHQAIHEAERQSLQTCEECGAPGRTTGARWMLTRCDAHRVDPNPPAYTSIGEE